VLFAAALLAGAAVDMIAESLCLFLKLRKCVQRDLLGESTRMGTPFVAEGRNAGAFCGGTTDRELDGGWWGGNFFEAPALELFPSGGQVATGTTALQV
jgi:hypothetical protein